MNDRVQVWQIPLHVSEETVQRYERCLAEDERSRANRFRFPDDRRRFIVARGTLRYLLSQHFQCVPHDIAFCYGKYGKPSVEPVGLESQMSAERQTTAQSAPGNCDFHFNVSHSGELALCVLGYAHRVGIDIEKIKKIQRLDGMMERCLVSSEQRYVEAATHPLKAFLTYWTCKEAYLKAIGLGLSQSMTSVQVEIDPPRLTAVPTGCEDGWKLHLIAVPEAYTAALVVAGGASVDVKHWAHSTMPA
ncbi:MAG: 4'-phosphopantetheinyl transferase family protein [Phormidesmis sp.]